eukprot:5354893-Pleurochrysis_carterae.AAC.1
MRVEAASSVIPLPCASSKRSNQNARCRSSARLAAPPPPVPNLTPPARIPACTVAARAPRLNSFCQYEGGEGKMRLAGQSAMLTRVPRFWPPCALW